MAEKVTRPKKKRGDGTVLFSDERLRIGGRSIAMREFRYIEGLTAAELARPIIAGLRKIADESEDVMAEALDAMIAQNRDAWMRLVAMSCCPPGEDDAAERERARFIDWMGKLVERDGSALSLAFWRVNGPFFTRRLVMGGALKVVLADALHLRKSLQSSSPADTDGTTTRSENA